MKSLKWSLLPVSNFILIITMIIPPGAFAQSDYERWKKQDVSRDRLDSIQDSAEIVMSSKEAMHLHLNLIQNSKHDPHLKRAMDLETRMIEKQHQIEEKNAQIEIIQKSARKSLAQKNSEIQKLKTEVAQLKRDQAKSRKSKKALFAAKVAGASLTCVSLYFQIRNILDSLRRVEIKQRDLVSRRNSLVTDQAKLELLEGKSADAKANWRSSKSASATAAEIAKAEKLLQDTEIELMQWKDVVNRSQQKILDAEETARIDQRAIARQRWSVGITAIGTLVIGLFGDKIILKLQEWMESDDPKSQEDEMLAFIEDWQKIKIEPTQASLLPSLNKAKLTPWEKSAVFFMTSNELGLKPGVVEKALNRYKKKNPKGYHRLQESAKKLLTYNLLQSIENADWRMSLSQDEKSRAAKQKFQRYTAVQDNTYVARPVFKPLTFGTKNQYKPMFNDALLNR